MRAGHHSAFNIVSKINQNLAPEMHPQPQDNPHLYTDDLPMEDPDQINRILPDIKGKINSQKTNS